MADPFAEGDRIAHADNPADRGTITRENVNPQLAALGYPRRVRIAWDDGSTGSEEVTDIRAAPVLRDTDDRDQDDYHGADL